MPVWYQLSQARGKKKLDVLRYKLQKVAVMDWYRIFPEDILDMLVELSHANLQNTPRPQLS